MLAAGCSADLRLTETTGSGEPTPTSSPVATAGPTATPPDAIPACQTPEMAIVHLTLAGESESADLAVAQGADLAVEEVNQRCQTDPVTLTTVELADVDAIDDEAIASQLESATAIIGPAFAPLGLRVAVTELGPITVWPTGVSTEQPDPAVVGWALGSPPELLGAGLADWALAQGYTRVWFECSDHRFGQAACRGAQLRLASSAAVDVGLGGHDAETRDFRTVIDVLRDVEPQAIMLLTSTASQDAFVATMEAAGGVDAALLVGPTGDLSASAYSELTADMIVSASNCPPSAARSTVEQTYAGVYGRQMPVLAGTGFDAVALVVGAARDGGVDDLEATIGNNFSAVCGDSGTPGPLGATDALVITTADRNSVVVAHDGLGAQ